MHALRCGVAFGVPVAEAPFARVAEAPFARGAEAPFARLAEAPFARVAEVCVERDRDREREGERVTPAFPGTPPHASLPMTLRVSENVLTTLLRLSMI